MAYGEVEHRERPRRRWGRRLLVTLLVLLIVLAALLLVADRVGENVAEQRISDQVSQELTGRGVQSAAPEVDIGGFPFLTQVLAENYESISIGLADVSTEGAGAAIRLPRVDVTAQDVHAPLGALTGGEGAIVAQTVSGTATISYASVAELIDRPGLRLSERDGALAASLPVEILGQEFTVTGQATVTARDGRIRVDFEELSADGLAGVPGAQSVVNRLAGEISIDVNVPELPFGIQVREVRPEPAGLAITASATDVPLNQAVG